MSNNTNAAGLYLWSVELANCNESLWVTTSKPSIVDASRQAVKALRTVKAHSPRATIKTIRTQGTIDA